MKILLLLKKLFSKNKKLCIFTFGRKRELEIAECYIKDKEKRKLRIEIIEKLHDYIEDNKNKKALRIAIENAIIHGSSGVWEYATTILLRLDNCDTYFSDSWISLAKYKLHTVRFRVACILDVMPHPYYNDVVELLKMDKSTKVLNMLEARIKERNNRN